MRYITRGGSVGACVVVVAAAFSYAGRPAALAAAGPVAANHAAVSEERSCQDVDGDGYGRDCPRGADCNDNDAMIHPRQTEICNFRDDDCDAEIDDGLTCGSLPTADGRLTIAAGEFVMGSAPGDGANDEQPRHRVWISAFELDQFEVTNRRYKVCVNSRGCTAPQMQTSHLRSGYYEDEHFADYPVIFVSKTQAEAYCHFAGGRLPTEAEWEKAARGQSPSLARFPWGNREPDCSLANMGGPHGCVGDTDRVGRRPLGQSPFGAMDMAGNVWEWVSDWYADDYYRLSPGRDPVGPVNGTLGIVRGGCWESGSDSLRVSCRQPTLLSTWANNIGFRCAYGKRG
jgi:formylglycine-generating enzyme required for sulfatase activity